MTWRLPFTPKPATHLYRARTSTTPKNPFSTANSTARAAAQAEPEQMARAAASCHPREGCAPHPAKGNALEDLAETPGCCAQLGLVRPDVPPEVGNTDVEVIAVVAGGGVEEGRPGRRVRLEAASNPARGSAAATPSYPAAQKLSYAASKRKLPRTEHFQENTASSRSASALISTLPRIRSA